MKGLKKAAACALSLTVFGAAMIGSSLSSAADTKAYVPDNGVMRENLTAMQASKEMGLGINLGNTMESYYLDRSRIDSGAQTIGENTPLNYETCWGAVETTQDVIDGMKDAGFNTVRVPVYWGNMMENDGTFTINGEYIARVKEIVDYCRSAGVYTVINIHHYDEFIIRRYTKDKDIEGCAETFKTLWTQIAEYFKDYSDYLIFEGFNEYLGGGPLADNGKDVIDLPVDEGYEWTNTMNQAFVDAVRATGGNNSERILIASGYWTNIDLTTADSFIVPTDTAENKLMVSVHYVDNSMYWTNKIGGTEWKNYSIDQCEKLKSAFTDKGIPVFVGETTSVYPNSNFAKNATVKTSSEALDYMLRLITDYGFAPALWDTNNNFYDRTNCKIKSDSDAAVIAAISAELPQLPTPEPPPSDSSSETSDSSVTDSTADSYSSSETSETDSVASSADPSSVSAADSSSQAASSTANTSLATSSAGKSSSAGSVANSKSSDENAKTGTGGALTAAVLTLIGISAITVVSRKSK